MTNEELNTELYQKLFAEQEDFKRWLLMQPPEEILKHAYEYVVREDIVIEMEFLDLTDDEARALLEDDRRLSCIFSLQEQSFPLPAQEGLSFVSFLPFILPPAALHSEEYQAAKQIHPANDR